jgi:outer membrane protein assembly factor BamB
LILCFDADKGGEPLWKQEYQDSYGAYGWGTGPAAAPTMDGDKVFVAVRDGTLLCLNMADGKILWKGEVAMSSKGYSASPLVWDDLLIVAGLLYNKNQSALLGAVNKNTGEVVWTYKNSPQKKKADIEYGHVPPTRMKLNGKDQVVYSTGVLVCGIDGRTGQPLWEHELEKGWGEGYTMCAPVFVWPFSYVTTSGNKPPIGLQFEGTNAKQVWKGFGGNTGKYAPAFGQATAVNGYIYSFEVSTSAAVNGGYFGGGPEGYLVCVDPKTGQVKWEEKTGNGSTLIAVDGCLLGLTYTGDLILVNPSPDGFMKITEWKGAVTRMPWLDKGKVYKKDLAFCWVGPVVAHGKLYLRYDDTLSCYDLLK